MLHIPSALCYGFFSSLMVFANKYLFTTWNFNYPIILILIQMITIVLIIEVVNLFAKNLKRADLFKKDYKYQFLTALFYSLHCITALKALIGLNIPMYAIFKRCTPFVNLMLSYVLFNNKSSKSNMVDAETGCTMRSKINFSISAMTFGVLIAGFGDLEFDLYAYIYCGISVIFQALSLSFMQKCGESNNKDSLGTLYLSSLFSIPLLLLAFLVTNEFNQLITYANDGSSSFYDLWFWVSVFLVTLFGCFLCFSQIWCTTNNNAITTSVIGVLKSFIHSTFGMLSFNAYEHMSLLSVLGITINLIFGTWYTYLKYIEKESKRSYSSSSMKEHLNI